MGRWDEKGGEGRHREIERDVESNLNFTSCQPHRVTSGRRRWEGEGGGEGERLAERRERKRE